MGPKDGIRCRTFLIAVMLVVVTLGVSVVSYGSEEDGVFGRMDYVALGDSVTYAIDGETHVRMMSPYPCLVSRDLGFRSHLNLAVSGATVTDVNADNNIFLQVERIPADTDIISVLIGGNDLLAGVPLGELGDDTRGTVYGAYDSLVVELRDRFPLAFVFFITQYDVPAVDGLNRAGYTVDDMADALKEVCDRHYIPVLDLNAMIGFDMVSDPGCDGIHPTQGFTRNEIAPRISDFIESMYVPVKKYVALGDSITYGYAPGGRMERA